MPKIITILLFIIFTSVNFAYAQEATVSKKVAREILLAKDKTRVWKMVETYDPYNGGTTIKLDTNLVQNVLIFSKRGTFEASEQQGAKFTQQATGKYLIKTDKKSLALVYTTQNLAKVPKEKQMVEYRYQIKSISDKEMILMRQGRHGWVEMKYVLSSKK